MTVGIKGIEESRKRRVQGIYTPELVPEPKLASRELTQTEAKTDAVGQAVLTQEPDFKRRRLEPNLAWAALQAGKGSEDASIRKLGGLDTRVKEQEQRIAQLLDLGKELAKLTSTEKTELSETTMAILQDLKGKGIDLSDKTTLTKQELTELKAAIGPRIDQSKTKINQLFTQIQTTIQLMSSINNLTKEIIQLDIRVKRTIQQFTGQK